jgi:hypothetical protein
LSKKSILSKSSIIWISTVLLALTGTGIWAWQRYGPSEGKVFTEVPADFPVAVTLDSASNACDLTVRRYRQIGKEMQFELAANAGGLAPYRVEVIQNGKLQKFESVPHRTAMWLTLPDLELNAGKTTIKISSLGLPGCETKAEFVYDAVKKTEVLEASKWVRQGSKDNWLDVRPVVRNNRIYLKDFANFKDGRTHVVMIDNIVVTGLENGLEVRPGYLYNVTAKWIDAPYNDWWNSLKNRSIRQQHIWIAPGLMQKEQSALTRINIPAWYKPSKDINVHFDTDFPEFDPIPGKLVIQYRLNNWVPPQNYFKRGITHLPAWEKEIPAEKMHWTASPNFFQDKNQDWFAALSKQEVETLANTVSPFNVYAFDFEFWNQIYPPEVKQRLIWFAERVRKNNPGMNLFDYWGGSAYTNPHFNTFNDKKPGSYLKDYETPKPNHTNFDPLPNGDSFQNVYNVSPSDVYPRPTSRVDEQGNTPNNFTLLSAIHALRINELIPFQKKNRSIFYAWNRYMPLDKDPSVPWHLETTNPKGDLIFGQLEMMPASQALSMSLFSLVLFDGYYIWHDSQPAGRGANAYRITPESTDWGKEWYPANAKTDISVFNRTVAKGEAPRYWDYPTEFYVLGNWMAKQVQDVLVGGKNQDLAYEWNGTWHEPKKGQAALAADKKEPFISAIVNGKKIAVLGVDSFQSPTATKKLMVRLPDGTKTLITLYGNWPSLYKGELK